jgi:DNA-binding NtrC family response regulator
LKDIDESAVIEALRRHDYKPGPAADELGLSRTSIYALIEGSERIRKAAELEEPEIRAALQGAAGDVAHAARALEVSERGLRLRMKQLDITLS